MAELDKRLELNIDEFLDSPKLRLKLSPAELDKSLLELYDNVSESPGGDILRLIGGGGAVAMQNLYMRRHAERDQWRNLRDGIALDIFPTYVDDIDTPDDKEKTVTQMIRRSLRRNIPQLDRQFTDREELNGNNAEKSQTTPRMCCIQKAPISKTFGVRTWSGLRPIRMPPRRSSIKLSILI